MTLEVATWAVSRVAMEALVEKGASVVAEEAEAAS